MILSQLTTSILDTDAILVDLGTIYGDNDLVKKEALFTLTIIQNIIEESEWYDVSKGDINSIYDLASSIIRNNNFVFTLNIVNLYYNINNPQTSFTYDELV